MGDDGWIGRDMHTDEESNGGKGTAGRSGRSLAHAQTVRIAVIHNRVSNDVEMSVECDEPDRETTSSYFVSGRELNWVNGKKLSTRREIARRFGVTKKRLYSQQKLTIASMACHILAGGGRASLFLTYGYCSVSSEDLVV